MVEKIAVELMRIQNTTTSVLSQTTTVICLKSKT